MLILAIIPFGAVGAVVLTNGDPGWYIRNRFQRKLLEVLFDGEPLADKDLAADAERYYEGIAAERKLLDRPADPDAVGKLASKYSKSFTAVNLPPTEPFFPGHMSLTIIVPFSLPSLIHNSSPCSPSLALKYRLPLTLVNSAGFEPFGPMYISLT